MLASILSLATLATYARAAGLLNATAYYRSYEAGSSIENSTVEGSVTFLWSPPTGVAIVVSVAKGLTVIDQSYPWHIHVKPVPPQVDGVDSCTKLGDKLNPSGTTVKCDPSNLNTCTMGDLSGKYGGFKGNRLGRINDVYVDDTLRFWPEDFSILGRSFSIHMPDGGPLACGNITSFIDGTAGADGIATGTLSTYQTYPEAAYPALVGEAPAYPNIYDKPDVTLKITEGSRTIDAPEALFTYFQGQTIADFPKSGNAKGELRYEDAAAPAPAPAPAPSAEGDAAALKAEPVVNVEIATSPVLGQPLTTLPATPAKKRQLRF